MSLVKQMTCLWYVDYLLGFASRFKGDAFFLNFSWRFLNLLTSTGLWNSAFDITHVLVVNKLLSSNLVFWIDFYQICVKYLSVFSATYCLFYIFIYIFQYCFNYTWFNVCQLFRTKTRVISNILLQSLDNISKLTKRRLKF